MASEFGASLSCLLGEGSAVAFNSLTRPSLFRKNGLRLFTALKIRTAVALNSEPRQGITMSPVFANWWVKRLRVVSAQYPGLTFVHFSSTFQSTRSRESRERLTSQTRRVRLLHAIHRWAAFPWRMSFQTMTKSFRLIPSVAAGRSSAFKFSRKHGGRNLTLKTKRG